MSTSQISNPLSKGSNHSVVEAKSFIAPEKEITMTFAEGPEALLEAQLRLTDQYSNPLQALVRETVSNALDAVIAKIGEGDYAKLPKGSVKISLLKDPSGTGAYIFKVEDEGIGMSEEALTENYARYNASSKITDMKVQGAKGLGAKVPFAYQDRFTGITTKDGVSISFTAVKSKEGFKLLLDSIIEDSPLNNGTSLVVSIRNKRDALEVAEAILFNYSAFSHYYPYEISLDEDLMKEVLDSSKSGYFFENYNARMFDKNRLKLISDKVLIHEETGLTGKLFVNLPEDPQEISSQGSKYSGLITDLHYSNPGNFPILSSGWLYGLDPDRNSVPKNPFYILEVKPGLLDFPSSRDSLIYNDRYRALVETVRKDLKKNPDNFTEFLEKILKRSSEGKKQQLTCELYDFIEGKAGSEESAFREAVEKTLSKKEELRNEGDTLTKFLAIGQMRVKGSKNRSRRFSTQTTYSPLYHFELYNEFEKNYSFFTTIIEKDNRNEKALVKRYLEVAGNYRNESHTFLVEKSTVDLYEGLFKVKKNLLRYLMAKEGFTEDDNCNLVFVESSGKVSSYAKKILTDTSTKFSVVDCVELLEGAKENKRAEERERRNKGKVSTPKKSSVNKEDTIAELGEEILSHIVRTENVKGLLMTKVDLMENTSKNILLKDSVKKVVVLPSWSCAESSYNYLINEGEIDKTDEVAMILSLSFRAFEVMEDKENRLIFCEQSNKPTSKAIREFKKSHSIDVAAGEAPHYRKDILDEASWERIATSFSLADYSHTGYYSHSPEVAAYLGEDFVKEYYPEIVDWGNGKYSIPGYFIFTGMPRETILEKLVEHPDTPEHLKSSAKGLLEAINTVKFNSRNFNKGIEIEDPEELKAVVDFLRARRGGSSKKVKGFHVK